MKPDLTNRLQQLGLFTRTIPVKPQTFDAKTRSVRAVFATENRVKVFDWERWDVVEEVLLMDGCDIPERMPFLDSHHRDYTADQLGSASDIKKEKDGDYDILTGTLNYGRTVRASEALALVEDGHASDVSIGYVVTVKQWIEQGAEWTSESGRKFIGPCSIAVRWQPKEISQTPIGADFYSKIRSDSGLQINKNDIEKLRSQITEKEAELSQLKSRTELLNQTIRLLTT